MTHSRDRKRSQRKPYVWADLSGRRALFVMRTSGQCTESRGAWRESPWSDWRFGQLYSIYVCVSTVNKYTGHRIIISLSFPFIPNMGKKWYPPRFIYGFFFRERSRRQSRLCGRFVFHHVWMLFFFEKKKILFSQHFRFVCSFEIFIQSHFQGDALYGFKLSIKSCQSVDSLPNGFDYEE